MEFLQKQLKYLKEILKKCLGRAKLRKSGAPSCSLPKYKFFEVMIFCMTELQKLSTESNIRLVHNNEWNEVTITEDNSRLDVKKVTT